MQPLQSLSGCDGCDVSSLYVYTQHMSQGWRATNQNRRWFKPGPGCTLASRPCAVDAGIHQRCEYSCYGHSSQTAKNHCTHDIHPLRSTPQSYLAPVPGRRKGEHRIHHCTEHTALLPDVSAHREQLACTYTQPIEFDSRNFTSTSGPPCAVST